MATEKAFIDVETRMRALLKEGDLPQPDSVEYGEACVRFLFHKTKTCVVVDLDDFGPDGDPDPMTTAPG